MDLFQNLPPAIYLPIAVVVTFLTVFLRLGKVSGTLAAIAKRVSNGGLVTETAVDKAVEQILSGGKTPTPLIDWIGDVCATILTKAPLWVDLSFGDKITILASLFENLPRRKIKKLVPNVPDKLLKDRRSKRILFRKIVGGNSVGLK